MMHQPSTDIELGSMSRTASDYSPDDSVHSRRPSHEATSVSSPPPSVTTDGSETHLLKKETLISGSSPSQWLEPPEVRNWTHRRIAAQEAVAEGITGIVRAPTPEPYPQGEIEVDLDAHKPVGVHDVTGCVITPSEGVASSANSAITTEPGEDSYEGGVSTTASQRGTTQTASRLRLEPDSSVVVPITNDLESGVAHTSQPQTTSGRQQRQSNTSRSPIRRALEVGTLAILAAAGTGISAGFTIDVHLGLPAFILGVGAIVVMALTGWAMTIASCRLPYTFAVMSCWAILAAVEGMLIYRAKRPSRLPPPLLLFG